MEQKDTHRILSGSKFKKLRLLAIEKARQTIPAIKQCFLSGLPAGHKLFVTIEISDGPGRHENAYVAVNSWHGTEIIGDLATKLCSIKAHAFGERLKFSQDRVIDWTITTPDGTEEGNHLGKLFDALALEGSGVNLENIDTSKTRAIGDTTTSATDRLFCKTPGCGVMHMACDASTARAILQAQFRTNPNPKYKFDCSKCSKTTEYSYSEVMQCIPVEKRPKPCPTGEFWAFVLLELPTSEKMLDRSFLAEPIRLRLAREIEGAWYAKLVSTSRFLQGLLPSDLLVGYRYGKFNVCRRLFRENQLLELPCISGMPQDSEFALLFHSKTEQPFNFRSGTLFCANPSCAYPFQLTYTQFLAMSPTAAQMAQDPDASYMFSVICPKCGTVRFSATEN